ncbi:YSIRK-type signal peptide-containing protein [Staphylococcus pseudintermedius]|nr:YSIRK-type signal peptide-containing protein [Staphylococcus pseudintermedius]
MKHMNSKSNRTLSRFSIRKCSVGTASFLIGTVAFFGIHHEAFAAENSTTPVTVAQLQDQGDTNEVSTENKMIHKQKRMHFLQMIQHLQQNNQKVIPNQRKIKK